MQSGSKQGTVLASWHTVSTKPQEHGVQADHVLHASHVGTQALGSVWHATSRNGSWSITEALATICAALFAAANNKSASVQLIVPSPVQALLTMSLLQDLDVANIGVSTAPTRLRHGSHPMVFVVSLPQDQDNTGGDYVEMVQEILRHDVRPDVDEVISVGEEPLLNTREARPLVNRDRRASGTLGLGRFADRGDLIQRLLHLSSTTQERMLPSYLMHDVDSMPVLMGHSDWPDENVVCLSGPKPLPVVTRFINAFSAKANVLTNCPELFGNRATPLKSLGSTQDFAKESLLCTWAGWLLVEPEPGRGGKPHRDAMLFMRAAATTRFITKLVLGKLDGGTAVKIPSPDNVTLRETDEDRPDPANDMLVEVVPTQLPSVQVPCQPSMDGKKHRCQLYSDIHEKKLREVVGRLTPGEIDMLFAGLEAQEIK